MGRGIRRAADAAAAELQVANKMAAKINNDAVADVERLLIKLLRRADGIPRQPFSAAGSATASTMACGAWRWCSAGVAAARCKKRGWRIIATLELY
jgi:hypothetical protein